LVSNKLLTECPVTVCVWKKGGNHDNLRRSRSSAPPKHETSVCPHFNVHMDTIMILVRIIKYLKLRLSAHNTFHSDGVRGVGTMFCDM
jgi:hypothetical protein